MDNRLRELEREIAQVKPTPFKRIRESKIIIADDFGEIKSGDWLRTLVNILSVICLICAVSTGVFLYRFINLSKENNLLVKEKVLAEKKRIVLTEQQELLMARLVISGKEPSEIMENQLEQGVHKNTFLPEKGTYPPPQ